MSFALVALLGAAGCVSVPAEAERPAPVASVRSGDAPAAQTSTPPAAPPAVHDALGKAEERPEHGGKKRKKKEEGVRAPTRRAGAVAPPARQQARSQPRRVAPARPEPPRRAGTPRRAQPRQTYDMRTVCATGQGVASSEIVDLCRAAYGR
ncbi:hypothetical protein ACWD04_07320 [Streptomyces sp. NPDC002911]